MRDIEMTYEQEEQNVDDGGATLQGLEEDEALRYRRELEAEEESHNCKGDSEPCVDCDIDAIHSHCEYCDEVHYNFG